VSERSRAAIMFTGLLWLRAAAGVCAELPAITDPTIAPGSDVAISDPSAAPQLRLKSTQVSNSSRSAVINDRIVTPGSKVNGATVLSIEPGRVQLRRGTEFITLLMPAPQVKRRVSGDES